MRKSHEIQEKLEHISSCTILWETKDDILNVKTRILPKLVEVTHYNGDNLLGGRIWPLPEQKKKELFDILYQCLEEWDCDDYTANPGDNMHWQFKICTKGKCLRIVSGSIEPPPHGQEIKDIIAGIIGDENFYFFPSHVNSKCRNGGSLRHFCPNDAAMLQEKRYPGKQLAEVTEMIEKWNTLYYSGKYFETFAIIYDSEIVGYCSLYEHSKSVISFGVNVFENERRNGYAFMALKELMKYAREKGYSIVQNQICEDNTASIRLHEKLSFESNGYVYHNQKNHNVVLYLKAL